MSEQDPVVLGIDIGTSNSAAAVLIGDTAQMVPSTEDGTVFPSDVTFDANGEFSAAELPALLNQIKADAETFVKGGIDSARIAIPASFDADQREATLQAGQQVFGEGNVELIEAPLAAAIAKCIKKDQKQTIMFLSIGAYTTDVVIGDVEVSPTNGQATLTVKEKSCGNELGGWDMDYAIFDHLLEKDREQPPLDEVYLCADRQRRGQLMAAIEGAKIQASLEGSGNIVTVIEGEVNGVHIQRQVNQTLMASDIEQIITPLIERCEQLVEGTLGSEEVKRSIDQLMLVGGPGRMPCLHKMLRKVFSINERIVGALNQIDPLNPFPMECVAKGAAMGAQVMPLLPYTLGVFRFGDAYRPILKQGQPYDHTLIDSIRLQVEPPEARFFILSEEKGDLSERSNPIRLYEVAVSKPGEMEIILEWNVEGYGVRCDVPGVGTVEPSSNGSFPIGAHLKEFTHFVFSFVKDLKYRLAKARKEHPELRPKLKISKADLKTACKSINAQTAGRLSNDEIKLAIAGGGGFIERVLANRGVPDRAIQGIGVLCDLLYQSPATRDKR